MPEFIKMNRLGKVLSRINQLAICPPQNANIKKRLKYPLDTWLDTCTFRYMSNYKKDELDKFAAYFKALSNRHRLQIFTRLVGICGLDKACDTDEDYSCCVGELGEDLNLAASTVSHHIKELCNAGLIQNQKSGKNVKCWISSEIVSELSEFFASGCLGETIKPEPALLETGQKVNLNDRKQQKE